MKERKNIYKKRINENSKESNDKKDIDEQWGNKFICCKSFNSGRGSDNDLWHFTCDDESSKSNDCIQEAYEWYDVQIPLHRVPLTLEVNWKCLWQDSETTECPWAVDTL